jgi:hypothetical protein
MSQQQMKDRMEFLANEMQKVAAGFGPTPPNQFSTDPELMIDLPNGNGGGGGYPKFVANNESLQKRWLAISTQLVTKIANPHISKDDINAVFNGIGMLGELYVEKFNPS